MCCDAVLIVHRSDFHICTFGLRCTRPDQRNRPRFASGRAQETERRQGELSVCPARSLHRETGLIQNSPAPPVAPGSSQGPKEPRSVSMQVMTRAPPPAISRAVGTSGSGHLRCSEPCEHTCQAGSQMSKVCVLGGQVPLRTLVDSCSCITGLRRSDIHPELRPVILHFICGPRPPHTAAEQRARLNVVLGSPAVIRSLVVWRTLVNRGATPPSIWPKWCATRQSVPIRSGPDAGDHPAGVKAPTVMPPSGRLKAADMLLPKGCARKASLLASPPCRLAGLDSSTNRSGPYCHCGPSSV